MLLKPQFTEKEKAALSIVAGFFSNGAWFAINLTWTKHNVIVIVAKPSVVLTHLLF